MKHNIQNGPGFFRRNHRLEELVPQGTSLSDSFQKPLPTKSIHQDIPLEHAMPLIVKVLYEDANKDVCPQ